MQKENTSEQEENNRNYFPFYLSLYVQPDRAENSPFANKAI